MPNKARPPRTPSNARRLLRSPQRSDNCGWRARILIAPGRQLQAFVELHGNIRAEQRLDLDRTFRCQFHHGAIEMRAERHTFFGKFAPLLDNDIT